MFLIADILMGKRIEWTGGRLRISGLNASIIILILGV